MSLTAAELLRLAARAELPIDDERAAVIAATVNHINGIVERLRELDFGDQAAAVPDVTG